MNISFEASHAEKLGINEAIIIRYLQFWIQKNKTAGKNQHEGRTWVFTAAAELAEHLKFLSVRQIRYAIKTLLDRQVILREQRGGHDRTAWYAFSDEVEFEISKVNPVRDGDQVTNPSLPSDKIVTSKLQECDIQGTNSSPVYGTVKEELRNVKESPPAPQGVNGTDLFGKPIGFIATATFIGKRKSSKPEHILTYEELLLRPTPEELTAYREWVIRRREKHGAREALDESKAKYCLQTMLPPILAAGHKRLDVFKAAAFGAWKGLHEPPTVKPNRNNSQEISGESRYRKKEQERQEVDEQRRQRQQNPMTPEVQAMVKNVLNGTGTHTA